jgi:hypothetical protein
MKCLLSFLFVLGVLCIAVGVPAQEARPIFDGRLLLKPTILPAPESALFKNEVLPAAKKFWEDQEELANCMPAGEACAVDMAKGSFTHAGSSQQALLYRYCQTGHGMALNGIAVFENGRVVAHILYAGGWDNAIGTMPDLNGDGLSKIVLAAGGTNMGQTWKSMAIIGIGESGVTPFGRIQTYIDNCGTGQKDGKARAWRLLVKPGSPQLFFRESFVNTGVCQGAGEWKKTQSLGKVSLDPDEIEYTLIK